MVKWDSSSIKEETKGRHRLEMHPNTPQNPAYCRAGVLVSPGSEGLSGAPEMGGPCGLPDFCSPLQEKVGYMVHKGMDAFENHFLAWAIREHGELSHPPSGPRSQIFLPDSPPLNPRLRPRHWARESVRLPVSDPWMLLASDSDINMFPQGWGHKKSGLSSSPEEVK